ncbi:hypothetical protein GLOIN_2v1763590 [Rhizophagus irregularis DAOM 181602=DAOM 197198]|nr:hypothetical protein GLOIN_2v1763590 [Rhizophagus irregularis DAOM 181602=DAOM 197198]POG81341.1 hypothetical protein GLOIN_2v1763590 [Rhizophagus irregularis DAOM 181602=DAOM 197198]|eukprot:XP_025188207.1 hypothetical protein GLOIN_2v1763590 [Rhizophagus irregularis DAOM 181602=DAOM 197198]
MVKEQCRRRHDDGTEGRETDKVVSCRNGKFSELLRRKWFVQEHQLSNHNEVIHAYNYVGKEQAKRIADSHHPP